MNKHFECRRALLAENLFENDEHMSRFAELVSCYHDYPFFTPGLCKCIYLSSWDMEHYLIILDILNDMTIGHSTSTSEMEDNGIMMEFDSDGRDREIFRLSGAFLSGAPYKPILDNVDEEGRYIIAKALRASEIIDAIYNQ